MKPRSAKKGPRHGTNNWDLKWEAELFEQSNGYGKFVAEHEGRKTFLFFSLGGEKLLPRYWALFSGPPALPLCQNNRTSPFPNEARHHYQS